MRKVSRMILRMRLRCAAFPTRLVITMPNRFAGLNRTDTTSGPDRARTPWALTVAKSSARLMSDARVIIFPFIRPTACCDRACVAA